MEYSETRCDLCDGGQNLPPGGDRVKVSENLGATAVVPVAPVDTYLSRYLIKKIGCLEIEIY